MIWKQTNKQTNKQTKKTHTKKKERKEKEKEIIPLLLEFSFRNCEWLNLGLCKIPNRNENLF